MSTSNEKRRHFIRQIIEDDIDNNKHGGKVITRFPPEPNGYLHIGHAKSICLNFGMAEDYSGICYLRFDDTNPTKEEQEYVEAIKQDLQWLGFNWNDHLFHASDYFEKIYQYAVILIEAGKAYVESLSIDKIREYRGTLQQPGTESPDRNRPIEESLDLFQRMKAGEFADGQYALRAKIDMQSGNINMRDPVIYRIRHAQHQRTGDTWCIYPMYDFAHSLSDAIECITHSLCTLEFQDHRPLYDWIVDNCETPCKPQQIEFARLNLSHTITSKRKLRILVDEGFVSDWDDPRMPTLRGMRRRGITPNAIRELCERTGISKSNCVIDMSVLEECVREDLNLNAPRAMCVLDPIKIIIENYPEDNVEILSAPCHPQKEELGNRELPFSRELYIERDDFLEDPPKKFFRLAPGKEVRLRNAYVIKCEDVIKDPQTDEIVELHCSYDPNTLGKKPEGRKVKGVIHWVSKAHAKTAEVRLYDRLFTVENPAAEENFTQHLNPNALNVVEHGFIEPSLVDANIEQTFQFERLGYFCVDSKDSCSEKLVFNRIVNLRDSWSKE